MEGPAVIAILGLVFVLMGAGFWFWGRGEEKHYYETMAKRPDAREFVTRYPVRPEPGGLKVGGYISLGLGMALFIAAFVLWLVD